MANDINTFAQVQTEAQHDDTSAMQALGYDYSLILTTFAIAAHVTNLKTADPNVPVYLFWNPYFGQGDKFWGTAEELALAIADYGMLKTDDTQMFYSGDGTTPLMDIRNEDWKDEFSSQFIQYINSSGADGGFVDTIPEEIPVTAVVPENPKNFTIADWKTQTLDFVDHVITALGTKPVLTNTGTREPSAALPIPNGDIRTKAIAGESIEAFGVLLPIDNSATELEWYVNQTILNDMASLATSDIVLIEVTATSGSESMRLYALCAYLLKQNSNTYFYFTTVADHSTNIVWRDEWDTPIGEPSGASAQDASGIYYREFENGLTLVNPTSGELSMDISGIHSAFRNWNGGNVLTTITLPAHSGKLLLKGAEPTFSWRD